MIETHVMNALLLPSVKDEPLFGVLTFMNGLVAPTFLFCAGAALAISLHRKWNDFTGFTPMLGRYVVKLFFILIVAYSLHVPLFSLKQMLTLQDEGKWMLFFQADILHIIAIALFMTVVIAVLVRNQNMLIRITAIIALVIVFISPLIREMDHTSLPVWFRPYLTTQFKSQFPFFPWAAFLLSGILVGFWFLKINERGEEEKLMPKLSLAALIAIILSLLIEAFPVTIDPNHNFWKASPEFFFVRLGLVVLLFVYLWWFEKRLTISNRSPVIMFGQESFLIYVVHLLVVYGYTFEWSYIRLFGHTLHYWESAGLTLGLILVMYIMAFIWHKLKKEYRKAATIIQYAVLAGIVVRFVFLD